MVAATSNIRRIGTTETTRRSSGPAVDGLDMGLSLQFCTVGHRFRAGPTLAGFGHTTALNVAAYCASVNSIPPGQRVDKQVEDTSETLYGSDGKRGRRHARAGEQVPGSPA